MSPAMCTDHRILDSSTWGPEPAGPRGRYACEVLRPRETQVVSAAGTRVFLGDELCSSGDVHMAV